MRRYELVAILLNMNSNYDRIHFSSKPSPERCPERLAAIATTYGLSPQDIETANVLELGCSTGENLIPLACAYPNSNFLGLDISKKQIAKASELVNLFELKNISFQVKDIASFEEGSEKYDYIICHGVFSWVDSETQESIFKLLRGRLSENGIGVISYNCHPGWQMRNRLKEIVSYADQANDSIEERCVRARKSLEVFLALLEEEYHPNSLLLKKEIHHVLAQSDSYLVHEVLNSSASSSMVSEFLSSAEEKDLQYLGDGRPSRMRFHKFHEEQLDHKHATAFSELATDEKKREQYIDFLFPVAFRSTLLCHKEQEISRSGVLGRIKEFYIASSLRLVDADSPIQNVETHEFFDSRGITREFQDPILKAALVALSDRWPKWIKFSEMRSEVEAILASFGARQVFFSNAEWANLSAQLERLFYDGSVEFHTQPPIFSLDIEEKPEVSAISRKQVEDEGWATNLRNEYVVLGDIERRLFRLLDGKHSHQDLQNELVGLLQTGELSVRQEGRVVTDLDQQRNCARDMVEETLSLIAKGAFFAESRT